MSSSNNATSSPTRRVRVDDTDAKIVYEGPWSVDTTGSQDKIGNFGRTFQGSLHGVIGTTANFSLIYDGASASVFGTVHVSNSSSGTDPSWKCFLDGRESPVPTTIPYPENNWKLCDFDAEKAGAGLHTLLVQVTSARRHFWLDYVEYAPSTSSLATTQNTFVSVLNTDPAVVYDDSWSPLGDIANYTTTFGGTMTLTFNGTSLGWYGLTPIEMDHGRSTATYSLDGEAPIEFTLRGLGDGASDTQYNRRFFMTPDRPYGTHNLTVTYLGRQTPLTLSNVVVRDSSSLSYQTQTINVVATPTSTSPSNSASTLSSSGVSGGTIAGAVIGVLLGVLLLVAGFIFGRRWYRRRTRPVIQPMPGFSVPRSASTAPLDIDMPMRYSVELEERMQQYGHLPMASPRHIRRRSRTFNPEVRETITSMDFDAPPMQHAPITMSNPDRDSVVSDAPPPTPEKDVHLQPVQPNSRGRPQGKSGLYQEISQMTESTASVNVVPRQPPQSRQVSGSAARDTYTSGYPYATDTSGMSNYEQLVAATKAEEARLESQRRSRSRRRP